MELRAMESMDIRRALNKNKQTQLYVNNNFLGMFLLVYFFL